MKPCRWIQYLERDDSMIDDAEPAHVMFHDHDVHDRCDAAATEICWMDAGR